MWSVGIRRGLGGFKFATGKAAPSNISASDKKMLAFQGLIHQATTQSKRVNQAKKPPEKKPIDPKLRERSTQSINQNLKRVVESTRVLTEEECKIEEKLYPRKKENPQMGFHGDT
jgi:hypothetical protein